MMSADEQLKDAIARIKETAPPTTWKIAEEREDGVTWWRGKLLIIASAAIEDDGEVWVHVSASYKDRLPSWDDLRAIKAILIGESRYAYQVLPPSDHSVNIHKYCLHMFAPVDPDADLMPDFTRGGDSI